ncbi:MAG: polyphosphate kinase 2, partial [Roseovarius sp.]
MDLPFDGAISTFFEHEASDEIRNAIRRADKGEIIEP